MPDHDPAISRYDPRYDDPRHNPIAFLPVTQEPSERFADTAFGAGARMPLTTNSIGRLLDYSGGAIRGAAIRAAGYAGAIRYVDTPANAGQKHVRPAEYADLTAAGCQVHLVFEVGTGDMLGGRQAGIANATRAVAGATWVGHTGLIFMACDMHLTAAQIPTALAYIDGAATVLGTGRTGVYGFTELITAARAGGHGAVFWQCGVNPGSVSGVHLWQRNDGTVQVGGVQCDINEQYQPIGSTDWFDMATIDDLRAAIKAELGNTVWQTTGTLPNRRGPNSTPSGSYADTLWGYAMTAEGATYRIEQAVSKLAGTTPSPSPAGSLSDADVQRVAAAVVKLLGQKTSS